MESSEHAERVHTAWTRPFALPASMSELRGPASGLLELPHHVYWGPERIVDLDSPAGVGKAYEATIREGLREDLRCLLNAARLRSVWDDLVLPIRIRTAWERALGASLR